MTYRLDRSRQLYERAVKSIAGGVNSSLRRLEQPVPVYFSRGKGPRLWDVDGNEYVDFQLGQGALLYGHAPDGLAAALAEQAKRGTHWAAQSELEIEVAERLQGMLPAAERVRFSNSATEAICTAFRLARARTGRRLILRFEGHYHGWSDEGLVGFAAPSDRWGTRDDPARLHPSQGVIPAMLDHIVVTPWNDSRRLAATIDRAADQIAAVVFEPILCNTGCIEPEPGFLALVVERCRRDGILIIADETITGLRFGAGCAQALLGFRADITVLGKAVGGGVPFAVVAGTEKAMSMIATGEVVHAGTLNANPLCLAAGRWALDQVLAQGPAHPSEIAELGRRLMRGLARLGVEHGIPLRPQGPGLVFHTAMLRHGAADGPMRDYRDYTLRHDAARWSDLRLRLLLHGVRAVERGLWFISLAHRTEDIDEALIRADRAFAEHAAAWQARLPEAAPRAN